MHVHVHVPCAGSLCECKAIRAKLYTVYRVTYEQRTIQACHRRTFENVLPSFGIGCCCHLWPRCRTNVGHARALLMSSYIRNAYITLGRIGYSAPPQTE